MKTEDATPRTRRTPADRQAGPRPSRAANDAICLMAFALMTGPDIVADLLFLPDEMRDELPLIGITAFVVCLMLHYSDLMERRHVKRLNGSPDPVDRENGES